MLYVYGNLPFEQRAIRRAINASPDIELDDQFIDSRRRRMWPIKLPADFASKYDAFILGDLDAAALGPANLNALAAAVEKGKGLLMLGGTAALAAAIIAARRWPMRCRSKSTGWKGPISTSASWTGFSSKGR